MSTLASGVWIGGRYLLERRLGLGGMGEVWLAEQHGAGAFRRRVVLKMLAPERRGDVRLAAMLADEARLVGLLHHPGIVSALDYVETEEHGPVFVLEYVDGASLRTALRHARKQHLQLPEALAVHIGVQVAHALHAAHTATGPDLAPLHIVHRDVSSDNVLLSRSGGVWLGDFGVARAAWDTGSRADGASPTGKRGYMPPEQLAGEPLGPTADVFALGRVVAEAADLACGRALRKVLDKATAEKPRDRFQTASELAEALAHACSPPPQPRVALGRWLEKAVPPLPVASISAPPPPRSEPPPAGIPSPPSVARLRESAPLFATVPPPRRVGLRIAASVAAMLVVLVPLGLLYGSHHGGARYAISRFAAVLSPPHGDLSVQSRPQAAEVYVDGELKGVTPLFIELSPGPHALRVGSPQLQRWRAEQVVVKPRTLHRLQVDLVP